MKEYGTRLNPETRREAPMFKAMLGPLSRARFFKYWHLPFRAGLRMDGKAVFRASTPPIKPQRDYRPKINRPVRA